MRFRLVHKSSTYLLVATSMLALLKSEEFGLPIQIVGLIALVLSWFFDPLNRPVHRRWMMAWNGLTVMFLLKLVFDIVSGRSVLISAIEFVLFLGVNKLFNRHKSSDYQQLYVLSLLQMIAATALSADLSFGVLLMIYVVALTWTLILFHLRREMEENLLLKYGSSLEGKPVEVERVLNSRRLVGGRFLVVTSGISLLIFLGAMIFFFLFPRIGFRFFQQSRPGITMTGFNDQVTLGDFGLIKDNPTVVMRVEFEDVKDRNRLPFYWRGLALDQYDGAEWSKSKQRSRQSLQEKQGRFPILSKRRMRGHTVRQTIYLEPMDQRVLFGLNSMREIEVPKPEGLDLPGQYRVIEKDAESDVYYEQRDDIAFRYIVHSQREAYPRSLWTQSLASYRSNYALYGYRNRERYLQLPDQLAPRIRDLAQTLTADAQTVQDAVRMLESHLTSQYAYTLNLERNVELPPLEDFLFEQKRGHCEYFASAMVIMLRSVGIGARLVNGFHGGQWNAYGQYLTVAQGDAHSWVEVLLPEHVCEGEKCMWENHWVTVDPTPSSDTPEDELGLLAQIRQYADAFRMRWYRYIVEYDLDQQVGAIVTVRDTWKSLGQSIRDLKPREAESRRRAIWFLGSMLICLLLIRLTSRYWGKLWAPTQTSSQKHVYRDVIGILDDFCHTLSRYELVRGEHQTVREFITHLPPLPGNGTLFSHDLLNTYEGIRFGHDWERQNNLPELKRQLREFKTALKRDPIL